jgi:TP901 family phage tail tape measure protein
MASGTRNAKIALTVDSRALNSGLGTAHRMLRMFSRDAAGALGGATKALGGMLKEIGTGALREVGSKGLDFIVDQGKSVLDFERNLTRFGIASRKSGAELDQTRDAIAQVSKETSVGRDEVLAGARAYVDLAGAQAFSIETMRTLARASQASQTDIKDLATVVYSLHNQLKIPDDQIESTLSGLINQSKDGTVHFQNMAHEIIAIAPQFARFGVVGREGANQLGAMFQIIGGGTKDASEASTEMQAIFRGLQLHADKFGKAGVHVFEKGPDGVKHFRAISSIFADIANSPLAKDPQLMAKVFGRGDGERAYALLSENVAKMRELEQAGESTTTVQADLNTYLTSSAGKIDTAFNKAKLSIAEAFTPERIEAFATALGKAADGFSAVIDGASKVVGFLEGAPDHNQRLDAENELFINPTLVDQSLSEKDAIARAQGILAAKSVDDLPSMSTNDPLGAGKMQMRGYAQSYGFDNLQAAAIRYLKSEGIDYKNSGENAWNAAMRGTAPIDEAKLATSIVNAMKTAGLGTVKVGSEPIVKAQGNSVLQRTRPGGRS